MGEVSMTKSVKRTVSRESVTWPPQSERIFMAQP